MFPPCPWDSQPLCHLAGLSMSQSLTPETRLQPGVTQASPEHLCFLSAQDPHLPTHLHPCSLHLDSTRPHKASPDSARQADLTAKTQITLIAWPLSRASSSLKAKGAEGHTCLTHLQRPRASHGTWNPVGIGICPSVPDRPDTGGPTRGHQEHQNRQPQVPRCLSRPAYRKRPWG